MFEFNKKDVNVGKNIKMIDFLKCELLNSVALLFEGLLKGVKESQEAILESIANIILVSYSLGKRLGIDYCEIDKRVKEKAKIHILEEHHLEKWYGELSSLNQHLKENRK